MQSALIAEIRSSDDQTAAAFEKSIRSLLPINKIGGWS